MIVVADTSPINYLVQIEREGLLSRLYSRLFIPDAVLGELCDPRAPDKVRRWAQALPEWVSVEQPTKAYSHPSITLDMGERFALQLALDLRADRILIDERKGSLAAQELGFLVTGTLGVLRDAHLTSLGDARKAYEALRAKTNFRVGEAVEAMFLDSLTRRFLRFAAE